MLRGRCSWRALPGFGNLIFVKPNLLREYDVDLRGLFYDFSQQASSFVRSTAVCSAAFRGDLLLQLLNPYHMIFAVTARSPSRRPARGCVSYFCVLRDEYRSISVQILAWPAASGFVCYLYRCYIFLAATS